MQELNILSLGAGVQSSTILIMAERGMLPRPDYAVFADTGKEPKAVYDYLAYIQTQTTIPVIVARKGNIETDLFERVAGERKRYANPPFFVKTPPDGKLAKLFRVCTKEYKIEVVQKAIRQEILGLKPRQRFPKDEIKINLWIGISTDEILRVKPSRVDWIEHRHILIEHGISRTDCLNWMELNGLKKPPKSSCTFCPFHSDQAWQDLKESEEWPDIVRIDEAIRGGYAGLKAGSELYLHRSLQPIAEIDFKDRIAKKEKKDHPTDEFAEECEGMCGV